MGILTFSNNPHIYGHALMMAVVDPTAVHILSVIVEALVQCKKLLHHICCSTYLQGSDDGN